MFNVDGKTFKVIVNELGVIIGVEEVVEQSAPDYSKEIAELKNEIAALRKEIEESMTAIATEMSKKIKFQMPNQQMANKQKEIRIRV
jgi:prefoldin subunit 5